MSMSAVVEAKNYITGEVEEELYAASDSIAANTTTPSSVAEGRIPDGYDAVAVSVACTQNEDVSFWLKVNGKQKYPNGLNTAGLGGLSDETLLLVKLSEGDKWEIGFTNTGSSAATVNWRFRIRLFKKGGVS